MDGEPPEVGGEDDGDDDGDDDGEDDGDDDGDEDGEVMVVMNKEGSILRMANLRQRSPHHHLHDHLRPTDHLLCIDNTGWRWRR